MLWQRANVWNISYVTFCSASLTIIYLHFPPMPELCPEMYSIKCMPVSISVTRCSLAHLINFTITSGKKYRQVRVIKCPLTQWNKNRKPNPNLKDTQTQMLTLKLQRDGLHSLLAGHFVTSIKIDHASSYMHSWTQVQCHTVASLETNPLNWIHL